MVALLPYRGIVVVSYLLATTRTSGGGGTREKQRLRNVDDVLIVVMEGSKSNLVLIQKLSDSEGVCFLFGW